MTSHKRSILVTVIESIDLCYAIKQGEFIMSNAMEIVNITPGLLQTILTTFNTDNERELTRKIFERLNELSENIRKQILNATDCSYCSSKCECKKYIFTYQGNEYTKCRFICNNFYFQNISNNDINDLMDIINNEILYNQTHTKKSKF